MLTAQEALRFKRALYRVMIYSKCFSACEYTEDRAEHLVNHGGWYEIRRQRVAMLSEYPTAELYEIHTIARFLRQLVDWLIQDLDPGSA